MITATIGKEQTTAFKWHTNTSQPDIPTLQQIANLLEIDIKELLNSTKDSLIENRMEQINKKSYLNK